MRNISQNEIKNILFTACNKAVASHSIDKTRYAHIQERILFEKALSGILGNYRNKDIEEALSQSSTILYNTMLTVNQMSCLKKIVDFFAYFIGYDAMSIAINDESKKIYGIYVNQTNNKFLSITKLIDQMTKEKERSDREFAEKYNNEFFSQGINIIQ